MRERREDSGAELMAIFAKGRTRDKGKDGVVGGGATEMIPNCSPKGRTNRGVLLAARRRVTPGLKGDNLTYFHKDPKQLGSF